MNAIEVSIPLEQGKVFRPINMKKSSFVMFQSLWNRAVSFDTALSQQCKGLFRFNPFGTGRCLSTKEWRKYQIAGMFQSLWNRAVSFDSSSYCYWVISSCVSIPLEQGGVFRLHTEYFQTITQISFNPFGTGRCLSTKKNVSS